MQVAVEVTLVCQLIKLIKSVTLLVLKEKKSLQWSAFFYEKRRLNKNGNITSKLKEKVRSRKNTTLRSRKNTTERSLPVFYYDVISSWSSCSPVELPCISCKNLLNFISKILEDNALFLQVSWKILEEKI